MDMVKDTLNRCRNINESFMDSIETPIPDWKKLVYCRELKMDKEVSAMSGKDRQELRNALDGDVRGGLKLSGAGKQMLKDMDYGKIKEYDKHILMYLYQTVPGKDYSRRSSRRHR